MNPKFSDEVRWLIKASGLSMYKLSEDAGVSQSALSRFMRGGSMTTNLLDKVAEVLKLCVVVFPKEGLKHAREERRGAAVG